MNTQEHTKKNRYQENFCALTASGILEDAVSALEQINDEIVAESKKDSFRIADKMAVIEFTDWFYQNANTEELEQALLQHWNNRYPELFRLASDYTLEGDLALADQIIGEMPADRKKLFDALLDYLWSFEGESIFNFWAGKTDYFETAIPPKENFQPDDESYYKNVIKVWAVRVIDLGGTILLRYVKDNRKTIANGFICKKGNFGAISAEGLKSALYSNGVMPKEMLDHMVFETAKLPGM